MNYSRRLLRVRETDRKIYFQTDARIHLQHICGVLSGNTLRITSFIKGKGIILGHFFYPLQPLENHTTIGVSSIFNESSISFCVNSWSTMFRAK